MKKIKNALVSVYYKEGLDLIVKKLKELEINIISTGGTAGYIENLGIEVMTVENLTSHPSILGGRVKTLHPKVFGGILTRRDNDQDIEQCKKYEIPEIDLVIVDLYPFEETVANTDDESEIIEKIDIGGISLIRAAAKNYNDVFVISSCSQYRRLIGILEEGKGFTAMDQRKLFAMEAFNISSHYDTAIFNYFNKDGDLKIFKKSILESNVLRYGENPHQEGIFYGNMNEVFKQLHGKAISYNNLVDIDAAYNLINEFKETTFVIIKHTNACGVASRPELVDAWKAALAGDPISAFGGCCITNRPVDEETAIEINKLFFEVIISPDYEKNALNLLKTKKNRIILRNNRTDFPERQFKSILNGVVEQGRDLKIESEEDMRTVTKIVPGKEEITDLIFANIVVKHTKSNTIVLVNEKQLIASGVGQTSRVDALKQAIVKARQFGFDINGVVMASDAFFPFADTVEIAHQAGITAVIQPGGSIRDKDSINFCNENNIAMVFTGTRHFKH